MNEPTVGTASADRRPTGSYLLIALGERKHLWGIVLPVAAVVAVVFLGFASWSLHRTAAAAEASAASVERIESALREIDTVVRALPK